MTRAGVIAIGALVAFGGLMNRGPLVCAVPAPGATLAIEPGVAVPIPQPIPAAIRSAETEPQGLPAADARAGKPQGTGAGNGSSPVPVRSR